MGLGALRALVNDTALDAFGLPVTVTTPGGAPVATTGIWSKPLAETMPFGTDLARNDPRLVLAIPRTSALDAVPRGSVIAAAETDDGALLQWRADGIDGQATAEWIRVVVVRA